MKLMTCCSGRRALLEHPRILLSTRPMTATELKSWYETPPAEATQRPV